jgi:hypothetical protein
MTRLKVMGSQHQPSERIEALQGLIERLSAPDLTLADATLLRSRLWDLLEVDGTSAAWDRTDAAPGLVPGPRCREGTRNEVPMPRTSMRAAFTV